MEETFPPSVGQTSMRTASFSMVTGWMVIGGNVSACSAALRKISSLRRHCFATGAILRLEKMHASQSRVRASYLAELAGESFGGVSFGAEDSVAVSAGAGAGAA